MSTLRRRLNAFDLTLITIGSIIGSGIFRNPAVVATRAHLPALAIGCWVAGGLIAIIGAFVFAELAARRPESGGIYAYLRDAYHPAVAFVFGWTLLLIADTGGTAAAAVLFSGYVIPLTGLQIEPRAIAVATLAILVVINALGVRQGGTWQNALVILKVVAIAGLIGAGLFAHPAAGASATLPGFDSNAALLGAFGFAMIPVLFAYNGFQGATYITGETVEPERTIPRGLIFGVLAVIAIYILVNVGCLRVLGPAGLAATKVPASDVVQAALGPIGARLIAIAIALSTLGFMSTRMLVSPRIYYQMAADGTFFKQIAYINPRTHVPTIAIIVEGVIAAAIALSGTFDQIVNWVVAPEWLFVVFAAGAIFIFRKRDGDGKKPTVRVPFHPFSTILLMAVLLAIFVAQVAIAPLDTLYGTLVIVGGIIFYFAWQRFVGTSSPTPAP
ncbi:MAG TPA: amino acid permease [Candidatus Acidoferrales bacterium]|nr:amino acid permease [Candidatus Acidoferrales bacterium]